MNPLAFVLVFVGGIALGWYFHRAWLEAVREDRLAAMRGLPMRTAKLHRRSRGSAA